MAIIPFSDSTSAVTAKTTTQTHAVACDDGYSGSGNAVCSPESGAVTSSWTGALVCTPAVCANLPSIAFSDITAAVSGKTTTQTQVVTCNDGYSGSATATCTADSSAVTAAWTGVPTCVAAVTTRTCSTMCMPLLAALNFCVLHARARVISYVHAFRILESKPHRLLT